MAALRKAVALRFLVRRDLAKATRELSSMDSQPSPSPRAHRLALSSAIVSDALTRSAGGGPYDLGAVAGGWGRSSVNEMNLSEIRELRGQHTTCALTASGAIGCNFTDLRLSLRLRDSSM